MSCGCGHALKNNFVVVANIPTPYRVNVFKSLKSNEFVILYCAGRESNRQWKIPVLPFQHEFLRERVRAASDGFNYIHNNPEVWSALSRLKPNVVITTGFNPTHLYAFLWAKLHGARHICMTDGTVQSEASLSWRHRLVRRVVYVGSHAFIAASRSGMQLYRDYAVSDKKIFQSHLCADNARFAALSANINRPYDVMFSGQLHERKLPFLFVDVCRKLMERRGNCRALVLGDGPLRAEVLGRLTEAGVEFAYPGFVEQAELPGWYSKSKLLLFTTRMDPWGVVANEALAAGTPVITTHYAGVAGELVVNGATGFVIPPDSDVWAEAASRLLDDHALWAAFSLAGQAKVAEYNYQAAADGILAACSYAMVQK